METPLDARSLEVLRIVVREHVRSGEPVSSRQAARYHSEQLSAATIRNLMAELTERGYLEQPHTSAGRVPSDRGYRWVVDEILTHEKHVPDGDAKQIEEILVSSRQVEDLLGRAGRLLGRMTNQVSLVIAPDVDSTVIEYVDFVRVAPLRVVAIFVGREGVVLHRVVEVDEDMTQEDLDHAAAQLREVVSGLTLPGARNRLIAMLREDHRWAGVLGRQATGAVLKLVAEPFTSEAGDVIVEGTSRLLDMPEFADLQRLRDLMRTIEERSRLIRLLDRCLTSPGVQVIIGSEAHDPDMAPLALVASPYRAGDLSHGLVGVLGPRRMEYARAVALVDHVARTLSGLLRGPSSRSENS